jgi:hypothetical protein
VTKKAGRPSEYTSEIANEICAQIADNKSIRTICKQKNMPAIRTIFYWLDKHEDFLQQYARAKELQADAIYEDIIEIEGDLRAEIIDPSTARVLIDSHKWRAGKMKPQKYGDKQQLKVTGDAGLTILTTNYTPPTAVDVTPEDEKIEHKP